MTGKSDDVFRCGGVEWHRAWTGDHYRWTAGDLSVGWHDIVYENAPDGGREGRRVYYAEVAGKRIGSRYPSTKAAMIDATRPRRRMAA
jgi:hypothetical protein